MTKNGSSLQNPCIDESPGVENYDPLNRVKNNSGDSSNSSIDLRTHLPSHTADVIFNESTFTSDITRESTPSSSSTSMSGKSSGRSKISSQDVRLILHLLVIIKPFKYLGDRKTSQTKKWELIQERYAESKQISNFHNDKSVPTVRTLQRQLASAIKQAKSRKGVQMQDEHETETTVTLSINGNSPIKDLEDSLLKLHELSERIKTGKISSGHGNGSQSRGTDVVSAQDPHSAVNNHKSFESKGQSVDLVSEISPSPLDTSNTIYQKVSHSRNEMRRLLNSVDTTSNKEKLAVLSQFLRHCDELDEAHEAYNDTVVKKADRIIKQHIQTLQDLIESSKKFMKEQSDLNKDVLTDFVKVFTKSDPTQSKNTANDQFNLKAPAELLNTDKRLG